ncbi:MAG: YwaF family protein [Clostridia bacterium]|nr:YwaF family protein [Clostridia bacterium]
MFWTPLHAYTLIPQFVVYIALAFVLSRALMNKDYETQLLPLKICTILLLVLEVAKQAVGIATGYSTYWIPLHFCSLFLYFHPIACFYKGKHRDTFILIAGVVSACLFLFMTVYPNIIYSDDAIRSMWAFVTGKGGSFFELHTVLFHGIGLFTFFLFVFQGLGRFDTKKDVLRIMITYGAYCLIVGPLAQLIDTNFNNFVQSNAPFLEDIRGKLLESLGAFLGQTVYVLIISVGTILVPLIAYFVLKGLTRLLGQRKREAADR